MDSTRPGCSTNDYSMIHSSSDGDQTVLMQNESGFPRLYKFDGVSHQKVVSGKAERVDSIRGAHCLQWLVIGRTCSRGDVLVALMYFGLLFTIDVGMFAMRL